jgi:Flp pilus assembly protein TadG
MVEFAILIPVFMILLLGMVEFGFLFANHQGIEYATREGARTGSALGNGQAGQNGLPVATTCTTIDNQVIAAVQRVITGKGSLININNVTQIRIFGADTNGTPITGEINVWTPGTGPMVDGLALKFKWTSGSWNACTRNAGGLTPDAVGVDLAYTYKMVTPLGSLLKWAGANTINMTDKTVMDLNP